MHDKAGFHGRGAAAIALLIHSYSDGNLHIPANALFFTTRTTPIPRS